MSKATLEFSLPEERDEHYAALNGMSYKIACQDMDNYLRGRLKYEDLSPEVHQAIQEARDTLTHLLLELEV